MPTIGKRRAYGQHFLHDPVVASKIATRAVDLAERNHCSALLEIGPGRGAITFPILDRLQSAEHLRHFVISERDRALSEYWLAPDQRRRVPPRISCSVFPGDFLDLPESHWLEHAPITVASNLPYSAGTAIVVKLAKHFHQISAMVLMFQAEVAKRLRAEPGTRDYGSLSVWIQNRWNVEKLLSVPPRSFSPPPQVDSEVVVLTPRAKPRIQVPEDSASEALWEQLVRLCFTHRRKMLRSSLPVSGEWRQILTESGVDETKRAEALDWDDWRKLYETARRKKT